MRMHKKSHPVALGSTYQAFDPAILNRVRALSSQRIGIDVCRFSCYNKGQMLKG